MPNYIKCLLVAAALSIAVGAYYMLRKIPTIVLLTTSLLFIAGFAGLEALEKNRRGSFFWLDAIGRVQGNPILSKYPMPITPTTK